MNVRIRKFKSNDAPAFFTAVQESVAAVGRWLPWCHEGYTIEDATEWVTTAEDNWRNDLDYRFIIENEDTGSILGSVGINQIVRAHGVGNLGYWVRSSETSQGVCSRASRQAVHFAFTELGFTRLEIHVLVDNIASAKVAEKIGARYEGTLRNKIRFNGVALPARAFSIIPADYGFGF